MDRNFTILFYFLLLSPVFSQNLNTIEPELVFVDGGDFRMGCILDKDPSCYSDEKPGTYVTLQDYWIGKYEITNAQFAAFLSEEGNQIEGHKPWYSIDKYALIEETKEGVFTSKKGFDRYPVNNVTWYGATAYTAWLSKKTNKSYRLPTEAEWEYAARGGKQSKGYLFSGSNNLEEISWSFEYAIHSKVDWGIEDQAGTFPVGLKMPNELGIYDMTGNLSEWVYDVYDYRYTGGFNPTGPTTGALRIVRGGSWDHEDDEARNTARTRAKPVSQFTANKGFRVVREKDHFSKIDTIAQKYNFNGVVLVKKQDDILYHKSFGVTNRKTRNPMSKETPFSIMSITKVFTATIILQLVEEGKIELHQTIAQYLPDYQGPAAKVVTVHQLLNHTSGIEHSEKIKSPDGETPSIYANRYTTDQLIQEHCSGPLVAAPGTLFNYDNGEYIILGKIIEQIEKDTYQNVLSRRILRPLKMEHTGLITNANQDEFRQGKGLPMGYSWDKNAKTFQEDEAVYVQNFFSSGGMYSTATDLAKFSDALFLNQSLLSISSMQALLQTYPEGNQYGYGLWVRFQDRGKQIIKVAHRPGRNMGINTGFTYVFDHDITIIILSNTDQINADSLTAFIQKQLFK